MGLWADLSEHQSVKSSSLSQSIRPQPSLLSVENYLKNNCPFFRGMGNRYTGSSFWQTFFIDWFDRKSTISAFFGRKGKLLVNVGNLFAKIVYILQTACLTFRGKQEKWNFITSTQPAQEGHGLDPIALKLKCFSWRVPDWYQQHQPTRKFIKQWL